MLLSFLIMFLPQISPAFKCAGIWPRSASHWPIPHVPWPNPNLVAEVKTEGFDLLSKESLYMKDKQSSAEGDAWVSHVLLLFSLTFLPLSSSQKNCKQTELQQTLQREMPGWAICCCCGHYLSFSCPCLLL